MKERIFIQKAKEHVNLEEFIRKQFAGVKCSNIEVQYTPIVTRIIIHTVTPGLVIGAGGERIRETVERIKEQFKIENPQIDVQKIERPNLDPIIVAQSIAMSLENSVNYKRLGKFYVEKIMDAGAIGCEIIMSGKLSGERSRRERFTEGYLKKCGETASRLVSKGFAVATPKLGNIGVTVKIMMKRPEPIAKEVFADVAEKEELKPEAEPVVKEETKNEKANEVAPEESATPKITQEEPLEEKIVSVEDTSEDSAEEDE
ncbi:MAG: 30S ribosomal protein S3 [Candidatus Aenigmarchaeota archaeon]|nr:30S ribosomal protein S3 [Candidatus Aenigmarchaeota archaeon]